MLGADAIPPLRPRHPTLAPPQAGQHDDLAKFLLMVRKKVKDPKVRGGAAAQGRRGNLDGCRPHAVPLSCSPSAHFGSLQSMHAQSTPARTAACLHLAACAQSPQPLCTIPGSHPPCPTTSPPCARPRWTRSWCTPTPRTRTLGRWRSSSPAATWQTCRRWETGGRAGTLALGAERAARLLVGGGAARRSAPAPRSLPNPSCLSAARRSFLAPPATLTFDTFSTRLAATAGASRRACTTLRASSTRASPTTAAWRPHSCGCTSSRQRWTRRARCARLRASKGVVCPR